MKIVKESQGGRGGAVSAEDLALINQLSRKELAAEDVYTFSVRLCDNEVDRDGERFAPQTLEGLAPMFVGKSGIFDHQWSAHNQTARIFRTELVYAPDEGKAALSGEDYCYLKAYAYMLRTEGNAEAIAEISGGIKKEVSVGCACEHLTCSVCGSDLHTAPCSHRKGETYNGEVCFGILTDPSDAYEWSFVAVPAQPKAGVTKKLDPHHSDPADETSANDMTEDEDLVTVEKLRFGGK